MFAQQMTENEGCVYLILCPARQIHQPWMLTFSTATGQGAGLKGGMFYLYRRLWLALNHENSWKTTWYVSGKVFGDKFTIECLT